VTWVLKKSRGLYFKITGDDPRLSAWAAEIDAMAAAGFRLQSINGLLDWNPGATDAQANCPDLHESLAALKEAAEPVWRARVANIYVPARLFGFETPDLPPRRSERV
jgi:hypothetical protein